MTLESAWIYEIHHFQLKFATINFEIAVKWSKSRIFEKFQLIMLRTPGKIHMYDMMKIDTILFEIVGGGGF